MPASVRHNSAVAIATLAVAALAQPTGQLTAQSEGAPAAQTADSGRVMIDGVNYYYEIHGAGQPLLLLHGGLGSGDMFDPVLGLLTKSRQVILVDIQGHGRTPLGNRPFSLEAMGNDMAVLMTKLGHDTLDVMGYSMGGGVAFQFAAQHPARVRKLVLVSAGYTDKAFYPEMKAQQAQVGAAMAEMMKDTPMYKSYAAVAPDVSEFPRLLQTVGDFMQRPYDFSPQIPDLTMPVMLIFGDSDMYQLEHVVDFYHRLGGGLRDAGWMGEHMSTNRLAILPGLTHYNIFMSPTLYETALTFFAGKDGAQSWASQVP
ncbi:MAG TPA: alpha/beta hydrolase [Gemmatimonadaceae bacterium]|nr:alpha/beta hydrolase [Gemmatimonadaceae bacterium]